MPPAFLCARRLAALVLFVASVFGVCGPRSSPLDIAGNPYSLIAADGDALCAVHDPSIAEEDGIQYVFSTDTASPPAPPFLRVRVSNDSMATWSTGGAIFDRIPAWALTLVPAATNMWAPDVSFFSGRWHIYYAVSSFGSETSVIGLVTTPTLRDPVWSDEGLVVKSDASSGFNAIDPNLVVDDANLWLVFGSFWSGIYGVRIDAESGTVDPRNSTVVHLAERSAPDALEGAFLFRREADFWLFASFDACCRGVHSTYNVRVGRASSVEGPFVDREGVAMLNGGGTHLIGGGFGWAAGGGQSILRSSASSCVTTMVLHAYDNVTGAPFLNIVDLVWNASDGWPEVA